MTAGDATAEHAFSKGGNMLTQLNDSVVTAAINNARQAESNGTAFPSPVDWRDVWIYFIFLDRFNNPQQAPKYPWNQVCNKRQGGSFKGVTAQLDYLQTLGCGAIWLTPVVKNAHPEDWDGNYHGYGAQDFLNIDERFASDGTRETAEVELEELVSQAHAKGIYVILDIVINHAGRVFDYLMNGQTVVAFSSEAAMNAPLGSEPPIEWLNGFGYPRADWETTIPAGQTLSADDAVYPEELRNQLFFRRRGSTISHQVPRDSSGVPIPDAFVHGDFDSLRQLVVEYDASVAGQEALRRKFGKNPVLSILVHSYSYLIARYGFDGFRIDTVKYVHPQMIEYFGNAIREFALSVGKKNFFTFGEIYDDEYTIDAFVGRNGARSSTDPSSFGIDAALDFPLFYKLPAVAKGFAPVETLRKVFEDRKESEKKNNLLSSHGEAGRYFVSFLDNHDQKQRFNHPLSDQHQIILGFAIMFCLQGIPSCYYGGEQGLDGTKTSDGKTDLDRSDACTREALWGKQPLAFDPQAPIFLALKQLGDCRKNLPALRFGRLYFREVSGNGQDFGHSSGAGGIVAFSRILGDVEVSIVANTSATTPFSGQVLRDPDLNGSQQDLRVQYSNYAKTGTVALQTVIDAHIYSDGVFAGSGEIAALSVDLAPMEVQIFAA